jgi:GTP-binding protein
MKSKPLITILGKPNVGKSTLFNRMIGEKKSIVSPVEGVTRDRVYGSFDWVGKMYDIIDTGGFVLNENDVMNKNIKIQLNIAKEESDFIIFMVDGKIETTANDYELAKNIRKLKKPYQLIVNKVDNLKNDVDNWRFYELGLGNPIFISAEHGRNIAALLDVIDSTVPSVSDEQTNDGTINFSIAGMPNVGKSSLVNCLINEEKSIVTNIAGTTRDAVDSHIKYFKDDFRLIDTAGIRKRSKLLDEIEYYSTVRSYRSIDESDVTAVVVDISKGFNKQDRNIVSYIIDKGKGLIIVLNKWDLIQKDNSTFKNIKQDIIDSYPILEFYPLLFISVKNNLRVREVLKAAQDTYYERQRVIKTSELNKFLEYIVHKYPPPSVNGKFLKIKYITQISGSPPLFALYCNFPHLFTINYKRYIENQLRKSFGLLGVPVRISFRKK